MTEVHYDALGQPVGFPVEAWRGSEPPPRAPMVGYRCRLEPLDVERHAQDLFTAYGQDVEGRGWTYLPYGPFATLADYRSWLEGACREDDPLFFAIVDGAMGRALGVASYLRITPGAGTIEVGHLNYAPALQRTPLATEAMYLMMRRVFDELGYRRYEWKCDALNAASRRAAERLGFVFEGLFRQATVYKGRNRDTAWFSIVDGEWPGVKCALEAWLAPENFTPEGRQRWRLGELLQEKRAGR
ncbi:MAG: GNAT family N-acetyltransferase [Candidatus Competibacterales bacterium]